MGEFQPFHLWLAVGNEDTPGLSGGALGLSVKQSSNERHTH